jgi:hypothetical protein
MPNFDGTSWQRENEFRADVEAWVARFPEWARGAAEWRRLVASPTPEGLFALMHAPPRPALTACPRVFVSHKQEDADLARCLAWIANQHGFEVWLDVLDPDLKAVAANRALSKEQISVLTAAIIEMGLLNSSHVLAAITPEAKSSRWVPYEYGRVKEDVPVTVRAACWLDRVARANLPEYFWLGAIFDRRSALEAWLQHECQVWVAPPPPAPRCQPEALGYTPPSVGPCAAGS